MCADFCFAACRVDVDHDTAKARLKAATDEQLAKWFENARGFAWEDWNDDDSETLRDHFAEALEVVYTDGRDRITGATFDDENREWVITGGLSYGDAPTDSYEPIQLIDVSKLTAGDS